MLNIIIADDEFYSGKLLQRLLEDNGDVKVVGNFINPFDAKEAIFSMKPDAVFLDIEMPELNGLQLAEEISAMPEPCDIVFVTAFNQYAVEAFRVNALDYLLKPVHKNELQRSLSRIAKNRGQSVAETDSRHQPHLEVTVQLFGRMTVTVDGKKESLRFHTGKCAELLAFMLLQKNDAEISKWRIMEALWPDKDEVKSDINLRSTVCRLNKTLKEEKTGLKMVSSRNSYKLVVSSVKMDIHDWDILGQTGENIDAFTAKCGIKLLEKINGSLLEDWEFDWCRLGREKYNRIFVRIAKQCVRWGISNGWNIGGLLKIVERVLILEPYDDALQDIALELHYLNGGKAAAVAYYQALSKSMKDELGIMPDTGLRDKLNRLIGEM